MMAPTGGTHGEIAMEFGFILRQFVKEHRLGIVLAAETGFLVSQQDQPDTVLAPDVAFVQIGREPPKGSPEREKFWHLAPDLVVEVASPVQGKRVMATKAREWLTTGVRLVWVVWPKTQQVDVWRPQQPLLTLTSTDNVDGYDILPGFTHLVGKIFA